MNGSFAGRKGQRKSDRKGGKRLVILGIDPGIAIVGYGVIEYDGFRMRLIDYGAILTPAGMKLPERLDIIFDSMTQLMERMRFAGKRGNPVV